MRVLVTGSRKWQQPLTIWLELYALGIRAYGDYDGGHFLTVVHGNAATGADRMAQQWAQQAQYELWKPVIIMEEPHPADWKIGRQAGIWRNQYMVDRGADLCLAFIRDNSPGATHCATAAQAAGIETRIFREESHE